MSPTHFVRLSQSVHLDLEWWFQFAKQWNGKAMIYRRPKELAQGLLVSDASGSWGCGAFFCDKWFQLEWAGNLKNTHISVKELVPITAIWGPEWSMESIEVKCNNAAVVAVLNSGSNRNPESGLLSQGSILGPLLFLIYIGDNLTSHSRLFADNCVIYREISESSGCSTMQEDLARVYEWTKKWQLALNRKAICISNKRRPPMHAYRPTMSQWNGRHF